MHRLASHSQVLQRLLALEQVLLRGAAGASSEADGVAGAWTPPMARALAPDTLGHVHSGSWFSPAAEVKIAAL
jgi:hypothetical protein